MGENTRYARPDGRILEDNASGLHPRVSSRAPKRMLATRCLCWRWIGNVKPSFQGCWSQKIAFDPVTTPSVEITL